MPGFLSDKEILSLLEAGQLLQQGSWDVKQIRHASYTLRQGAEVRLRDPRRSREPADTGFTVCNVEPGTPVAIPPGATAMLYSAERLVLPPDVLAFTVARGLLFVEGLTPENTYVDPGFSGSIYTTVTNVTPRTLRIPYAMPICRIFFYQLDQDVERPYVSGPTLGIAQQLDEMPADPLLTMAEIATSSTSHLVGLLAGDAQAQGVLTQLLRRARLIALSLAALALVWPVALIALYALRDDSAVQNVLIGAVGSLVAAAIWAVAAGLINKSRQRGPADRA